MSGFYKKYINPKYPKIPIDPRTVKKNHIINNT